MLQLSNRLTIITSSFSMTGSQWQRTQAQVASACCVTLLADGGN